MRTIPPSLFRNNLLGILSWNFQGPLDAILPIILLPFLRNWRWHLFLGKTLDLHTLKSCNPYRIFHLSLSLLNLKFHELFQSLSLYSRTSLQFFFHFLLLFLLIHLRAQHLRFQRSFEVSFHFSLITEFLKDLELEKF